MVMLPFNKAHRNYFFHRNYIYLVEFVRYGKFSVKSKIFLFVTPK